MLGCNGLTTSSELGQKFARFLTQWFLFGFYVGVCSCLVMLLEDDYQRARSHHREATWNRTKELLFGYLDNGTIHSCSLASADCNRDHYQRLIDEVMEAAQLMVEAKWDQSWDLVNSLYYCSSLYTTVGYGDMVCRTPGGKLFTILFIVTSVPLWFSTLAQLGYFLHLLLFKTWSSLRCFCCTAHFGWGCSLPVTPPFVFMALVTFLSLGIMSYIMSYLEEKTFFEAFYFAVVTFSTVGLGDVVPTSTLGKLRCLLVSFTVGFAILSAWITNVADIIYARNFDSAVDLSPQSPMMRKSSDPLDRKGKGVARIQPQFFLRSHTQRVKHLRKVAKARICRKPSHQEMMSLSTAAGSSSRRRDRRVATTTRADAKRLPRNYDCYSQEEDEDDLINQNSMKMKCCASTVSHHQEQQTQVIINPISTSESVVLRKSSLNRTETNKVYSF